MSVTKVIPKAKPQVRRAVPRWARMAIVIALTYFLLAYVILPRVWKRHEEALSSIQASPRLTHTASDIPGDPLNIGVVGTEEDLIRAMTAGGWDPADPLTFRSSARIVIDTVLRKPDDDAPVSNLYLFGRKEDLAFEKPVGASPKERHHVRLWRIAQSYNHRPAWIGSAAYDIGVELSRTTGEVTHHISPDLDAERDLLVADLTKSFPANVEWLDGFHRVLHGRNGGGDAWRTDGRLAVVILPLVKGTSNPTPQSNE